MATLEDKLLSGPTINYCSSSSSDNESEPEENASEDKGIPIKKWTGTSSNTGPKGVLSDCKEFENEELQLRRRLDREKIEMIKKYSITCKSALDDERDRLKETDPELTELYDDYLLNYQRNRMKEMFLNEKRFQFGSVEMLNNGEQFLNIVDGDALKEAVIVIHLFEKKVRCCELLNECLDELAKQYYWIKFCKLVATNAGLSSFFKMSGIPAILVYKSGQIIGNFVRITDELGLDFDTDHVRDFLIENSVLPDLSLLPNLLTDSN